MANVVAYIADWAFSGRLSAEQAALLTHVNYAFGHVVEGEVSYGHLNHLPALASLRRAYPQLKVNLSVGGWGADGFSQAVADDAGRRCLARSGVEAVRRLGLTGIDWDWEYPGCGDAGIAFHPDDAGRVTEMLEIARALLDDAGRADGLRYQQSIAVGAGRVDDYHWPDELPALDTVNLMTYDMGMGDRVGHTTNLRPSPNAAYSAQQSAQAFRSAGVPADRLLIGAAFYCHAFLGVDAARPLGNRYREKGRSLPCDAIDDGYEYHWDDEARAAWYRRGDAAYTGDDARSLSEKADYIRAQGLGGIIIWELNHDRANRLLPALGALRG